MTIAFLQPPPYIRSTSRNFLPLAPTNRKDSPMMMELRINNKSYTVEAPAGESLLSVLRHYVGLTGTKYGCGEGVCGACTVLIDGVAARTCILPAAAARGKAITTIEGLEQNGTLHPVQQACLDVDVFQCAYCAPGMIMSAVSLLDRTPAPTREQIVAGLQGNVCRCGTYPRIVQAIQKASGAAGKQ